MLGKTPYMGANDYVEMNDGLDSSMLASLGRRRRRRVLICLVLVLALLAALPWAASKPAVYQRLSRVAPPVVHFLMPRAGAHEADGIRTEAADVRQEGDTFVIHLTMEDMEADRLDGSTVPGWWEYFQESGSATGRVTWEYDEETGLVHLYLTCEAGDLDPNSWVTVTIHGLSTRQGAIQGPWQLLVSPTPEE